jgi:dTDP-glucose 4,6-dehydratase
MKLLVTGGAGFIGSNFIHYWLKKYPKDKIVNLDKLTYAGSLESLQDVVKNPRYRFIKGDICNPAVVRRAIKKVDIIVHFAAESVPGHLYVPIQSAVGTRVVTFGELWDEQSAKNRPRKHAGREAIFLKGKQTKALSFLNGGQWMPIRVITRHWYKGTLVKLRQKWGSIEATPNHSIYSANLVLTSPKENPGLLVIREVNEIRKVYKRRSKNLLRILAAYITEGNATFNKANGGYIVEFSQSSREWVRDLGQAINKEFALKYTVITHKKKEYKNVYGLQVSNKKLFNFLTKECGKYCDGKYFPNWVFDLKPAQREYFWQKLVEGDGTKDGRYSTTSAKLTSQISLLLALQGKKFTVYEYERGKFKKSWELKTSLSGQHYGLNNRGKVKIHYEGWVYDLEIEKTHNFACGIGNVVCHNTHVDRSILGPAVSIKTNILGTQVLLDAALEKKVKRFHHISTDEVFGELELGTKEKFSEKTPYHPRSPYAASKAASDHLVRSYFYTYGLPITITNCSNNFGPYQFPEKFIPLSITNLLEDKKIPIYGDGLYVRDWLYVEDHCRAIDLIIKKGKAGETYCVGGLTRDIPNIEIAKKICQITGKKPKESIGYVRDRPGHDRRYAINWHKIKKELGWKPRADFDNYLRKTIDWYRKNEWWWEPLKEKQNRYFKKQYGKK